MSLPTPFAIHGILQLVIFLGLYPMGALVAIFRESIGPSWRRLHISLQMTASLLFLLSAGIVGYGLQRSNVSVQDMKPIMKTHIYLGRTLVVLVLAQLLWAFYGRRLVDWTRWYSVHMMFSAMILLGGWINIGLAKYSH